MAKHKGQKAKNKSKKAKKAQVPLGPGGTLSKKQKMKQNKVIVTSYLQQKKAHGADYKKMRAHGAVKNWKKFAEEVKKAWNGTPETLFFLQNSMNAREVFMAVFKGGRQPQAPRIAAAAPVAAPVAAPPPAPVAAPVAAAAPSAPVAAAAPPPPPAAVLQPGAEEGELDEALAAEFVPC
jgi:hypothetical protein